MKANDHKDNKCSKVRPFLVKLNQNFQKFEVVHENLLIDEMIVRYYGHHSIK